MNEDQPVTPAEDLDLLAAAYAEAWGRRADSGDDSVEVLRRPSSAAGCPGTEAPT